VVRLRSSAFSYSTMHMTPPYWLKVRNNGLNPEFLFLVFAYYWTDENGHTGLIPVSSYWTLKSCHSWHKEIELSIMSSSEEVLFVEIYLCDQEHNSGRM
jgi:hypothetical protein